jgi:glycerol kinase
MTDVLQTTIEKSDFSYNSSMIGAAYLSGLTVGLWDELNSLKKYRKHLTKYEPNSLVNHDSEFFKWKNAISRYSN